MKFWTSPEEIQKFEAAFDKRLKEGPDQKLYFLVGFFITAYAIVELRITLMLAKATKITQLQSFDLLTRGMDVKTKIERLRRACETGPALGPNLSSRLTIVDEVMRPLRNKIAHSYATLDRAERTMRFVTLAAFPKDLPNRHPDARDSETIDVAELFEAIAWLRMLSTELSEAYRWQSQLGIFEIANPRSPLRHGSSQSPGQPKNASVRGRRERKRQRKGQPLRASERK